MSGHDTTGEAARNARGTAVAECLAETWEDYWRVRGFSQVRLAADVAEVDRMACRVLEFSIRHLYVTGGDETMPGQALMLLLLFGVELALLAADGPPPRALA